MNVQNGVKLLSAATLSLVIMAACGDKKAAKKGTNVKSEAAIAAAGNTGAKLAYVNADTLNKYYLYLKDKQASFEKKQNAYEAEISKKQRDLQNEAMSFQKKAQAGTLTQSEGEAAQKRLSQKQQELEQRNQRISALLSKEQMAIQDEFQSKLDAFLKKYNDDKHYDFIFTYSKNGGPILFANPELEITQEVLDAMNDDYKNGGADKDEAADIDTSTSK